MRSEPGKRRVFAAEALVILLLASACGSSGDAGGDLGHAKIGFIFVGRHDDLGYNQAAWEGSEAVARAFPDNLVLRTEDVPESEEAVGAMERLIDEGARIIFATSYGHLPFAERVARRHPDVVVLHQGGVEPSPGLDNLGTYWGTVFEPVYLAGIAAGSTTRTNRLGYVVAFSIPATYNNVNAFTLGARSVNPKAITEVVFTGDWCKPDRQAAAVDRLLVAGADVITQHQDCARTILEVAERRGVYSVGYHYDGSEVAPRGWLLGSVWDWRRLFVDIVGSVLTGSFRAGPYNSNFVGGLARGNNPFVLTELGSGVPPAVRRLIAAAESRFRGGGSPFEGPLRDRTGRLRVPAGALPSYEEILKMDYFVPGVVGMP